MENKLHNSGKCYVIFNKYPSADFYYPALVYGDKKYAENIAKANNAIMIECEPKKGSEYE